MSERVQELRDTRMKKVVRAYERGEPLNSIASLVGVSPPTISKWLIQEGYKKKGKGRIPDAMKRRVADLQKRGWNDGQISSLLNLSVERVREFSEPIENPIMGEKDPLKTRGGKRKKKAKGTKGKRGRPTKDEKSKTPGWPPPRHKCRKHWTPVEEAYVMQMMEDKVAPAEIYKRMRASKARQRRIWQKYGGKGNPPNFPPPKDPFTPPTPPSSDAAKKRREEAKAISDASVERLKQLEAEAEARKQKIAELEAEAAKDERRLKKLQQLNKEFKEEVRQRVEQSEAARKKITKQLKDLPTPGRRRVLPGSYEAEVEGRKVGALKVPKKKGRKALPAVGNGKYSDNGRYFTVSDRWPQLRGAARDEVEVYAAYLDSHKFPARATRKGELPSGYLNEEWPDKVDERWEKVNADALDLVKRYQERKLELRKSQNYSKQIIRYLVAAYDAYRNPKFKNLDAKKREALRENVLEQFARAKKIDRLIMIFSLGVAEPDGAPTAKGIDRGFAARALLEKESRRVAGRIGKAKAGQKAIAGQKKITDEDITKAILAGNLTGDESDEEIERILGGSIKALEE